MDNKIEKISRSEAQNRVRAAARAHESGYWIQHIEDWFPTLEKEYPDCTYAMTPMSSPTGGWRKLSEVIAVIIEDEDEEIELHIWLDNFYTERFNEVMKELNEKNKI